MDIKREYMKKKVLLVLYIIFGILTFVGALYYLYNKEKANPLYFVIPMLFNLILNVLYRNSKKAIEENEKK